MKDGWQDAPFVLRDLAEASCTIGYISRTEILLNKKLIAK